MNVKICGITTIEDALVAVNAGADMLGFNFYCRSKRYLPPDSYKKICNSLNKSEIPVIKVGVFVDAEYEEIEKFLKNFEVDLIQLSGNEPPDLLHKLGERAYKSLRPSSLSHARELICGYPKRLRPPMFLVDTLSSGDFGGSGLIGDWELMRNLALEAKIFIAGGLTPLNVKSAIEYIQPWGVDVASGVESSPGIKDISKMVSFIKTAKNY